MYKFTGDFSFFDAMAESEKRREIARRRKQLAELNVKIGTIVKTPHGVEVISDFDTARAKIKTFSGHQYAPTEIKKVG